MTTIITRLYADEKSASKAADRLWRARIPRRALQVVSAKSGESKSDLKDRLKSAKVHASALTAYADKIADGNAVLVARTTYKPLGAAKIARDLLAKDQTISVAKVTDEHFEADGPDHAPSVFKEHPRFLTVLGPPGEGHGDPVSKSLGWRLLSAHKTRNSAWHGGGHVSRMFWPMKLVSKNRKASSAKRGGGHMSRAFWPMPLISRNKRRLSVIQGGDHPMSRFMGWDTVTDRN